MKKNIWRTLFLTVFLMNMLLPTVSAGAASAKKQALSAYADMLAAMPKSSRFALIKVNNDSVPELVVQAADDECKMFRWNKSVILPVLEEEEFALIKWGILEGYYKGRNLVCFKNFNGDVVHMSYKEGSLKTILWTDGSRYYSGVGKKYDQVSPGIYDRDLADLAGSVKQSRLPYKKNTAAQRKKTLGKKGKAASISLKKTTVELKTGKTLKLKAVVKGASKKIKWKSSDTKVVKVSSTGKLKAKTPGRAVITASANHLQAKCAVTVLDKNGMAPPDDDIGVRYASSVELVRKKNPDGDMTCFVLEGRDEKGDVVWSYSSGNYYEGAQIDDFRYIENKGVVYILENGKYTAVSADIGENLVLEKELDEHFGPASLYVDDGTLYAVPIDGESAVYVISREGVIVLKRSFDLPEQVMGKEIKGMEEDALIVGSEGSDVTVKVYIDI